METILVSACLLGEPVRYDGQHKRCQNLILQRWLGEGRVLPICPEVSGGLWVPRLPAEIIAGAGGEAVVQGVAQVMDKAGKDVTGHFIDGAGYAMNLAMSRGIHMAVLKEGSPSCGSGYTYSGTFTGVKVARAGVTTAMLRQAGVQVFNENQFEEADAFLTALEIRKND